MPNDIAQRIQNNYTSASMLERIQLALEYSGFGSGPLQWTDLVPFDQFHVRGLEATKDLAAGLQLEPGMSVLDVGSGLGGPARYLAARHGAHVTGIDLTDSYVEISSYLSERAGLTGAVSFQQGDATALPFPDQSFDIVWTQHVAMNIEDKARLYQGMHRVLKHGGRLALYDPIQGDTQPILYPTPWAREAGISFVATEQELKQTLTNSGFHIVSSLDKTGIASEWFARLRAQLAPAAGTNPLSPVAILGPEIAPAIANFGKNILEGRVRLIEIIASKA